MFVGNNLYAQYARFLDLNEREFFVGCLDAAKRHLKPEMRKEDAPIVFCSTLTSQTKEEKLVPVKRRVVHDDTRVKRRFLMIDADYEAGQGPDSDALRRAIMEFGAEHNTPVMIYPSFSFPDKPRFRAVFLVDTLLDARRHHQAMRWLYEQLDSESTDASDLRITTNRNLPVFRDNDMVEAVYSTFEDESLEPLDHDLFFDRKDLLPPKAETHNFEPLADVEYDTSALDAVAESLRSRTGFNTYEGSWYIVASVAFDVFEGRISEEEADRLMVAFAEDAPDEPTRTSWTRGNRDLLTKHVERYRNDPEERARARPLYAYAQARSLVG